MPDRSAGPGYARDLFAGTAQDYERYRPGYADALLDHLRARVPVSGNGRLLDVACGTGQIAFALASGFVEVVGVDQEAEFIELARRKASALGLTHTRWMAAAIEETGLRGSYELITIGNAFHRLNRERAARALLPHVEPGGCLALLWSEMPWRGGLRWQQALAGLLDRWRGNMSAAGRVPAGWEMAMARDPHAAVLRRAGFRYEGRFEFEVMRRWTIESLIGLIYSTSFLSRRVQGGRAREFEAEVRDCLTSLAAADGFLQTTVDACELARRP